MLLRDRIEALAVRDPASRTHADRALLAEFRAELNAGRIRAAERDGDGTWRPNAWVKRGILTAFRLGTPVDMSPEDRSLGFFDKDTLPLRALHTDDAVRVVPGGSSIRDGAFVAQGVVVMPPAFVNIGAYVDEGTMIDSHALVGSCAQIGKRVHISAAAQIGGVLEPVGELPVVVEDDVLVGGGCGVYEGTIVRERAVLAPGTILSGATPVYDLCRERVYMRGGDSPLEIPAGAVVVPGARALETAVASAWGISLYAGVVVKYRDERTDRAVRLERDLR